MSALGGAEELDFGLVFEEDDGLSAGGRLEVRTPPSSTFGPELQGHCDFGHHGFQVEGNAPAFHCPSIQITAIAPTNPLEVQVVAGGAGGGYSEASWSRDQLYLPLDPCYRDPALSPSPCSSLSSRSWVSDLSSCESFSQGYDDVDGELRTAAHLALGSPGCGGGAFGVELWQQNYQQPSGCSPALSPYQSPSHSPRTSITEDSWLHPRPASRPSSRPTSPCGKRWHSSADPQPHSPSPSPHHSPSASPRGSVTDNPWAGSPGGAPGPLLMTGYQDLDIPSKTRRTLGNQPGFLGGPAGLEPFLDSPVEDGWDQDQDQLFLQVPSTFSWGKTRPGNPPLFCASSPPPLDWPLPSRYAQCELKVEVEPRPFHRAHYETEGSRGSIKAVGGGHPVVTLNGFCQRPLSLLLFIGTADERCVRPHSFYQVHRVTGKTVTTACQEKILGCTKVLQVPLLPEHNMSSSIDCAGILKLRNADIELKKGETDVGRKNTRVRVVFRTAVPQPDGQTLWLQTASVPVECSQRSGQDLPHMETLRPSSGSADGGEELIITGSNMAAQSRVVFVEKGPDGSVLWEMDARVLSGRCSRSSMAIETPRYRTSVAAPVQVLVYMSNGKRRRSFPQSFTFLPLAESLVKQEPWDHGAPPSQSAPRLHHPPPSYAPLLFPHSSSLPTHIASICSQTSVPHPPVPQTLVPQTSVPHPPIHQTLVPQTLVSQTPIPQTPVPQTLVPQNFLPQTPVPHPPIPQTPVLPVAACAYPRGAAEEALSIKQEPHLECLGLQEITLDDVNEVIDRDIGGQSAQTQPGQFQCWEPRCCEVAPPFCEGPR